MIDWHYADNFKSGSASVSLSEGTALVDEAGKLGKLEKKPIVVTLTNKEKGDMYLTDLTLGVYLELDIIIMLTAVFMRLSCRTT